MQVSALCETGKKLIHSKSKISSSYENIFPSNVLQMAVSSELHLWFPYYFVCGMFLLGMLISPIADKHRNSAVVQTAYLWSVWGVSFLLPDIQGKEMIFYQMR